MGDPAGVGLEVTLKIWRWAAAGARACPFSIVLYGDVDAVSAYARLAGMANPSVKVASAAEAAGLWPACLPVKQIGLVRDVQPGRPNSANSPAVITSIEEATAAVIKGQADALVTNPISKAVLYQAGFRHPGHTEFLGEIAEREAGGGPYHPVMMLAADELRVVPLTIHVPLVDVPRSLSRELLIATARTVETALIRDFAIGRGGRPRITVTGLNPHAGEGGTMGTEERDIIRPAVATLAAEGLAINGPYAADTLFHADARATYDAVIAMYHDQALIPIKTVAFDRAVNVTLGLPFVRTSPDHGTAFEIAGKGQASPESLYESLRLATCLVARRRTQRARK
jgi:4-hydroxythreonine-4-phosphate dehydrogenase